MSGARRFSVSRSLLWLWPFLSVPRVWYLLRAGAPPDAGALDFAGRVLGLGVLRDGLTVALLLLPVQLAYRLGWAQRVSARVRARIAAVLTLALAALLCGLMLDAEFLRYFGFHSTPTHLALAAEWGRISSSVDFYVGPFTALLHGLLVPGAFLWLCARRRAAPPAPRLATARGFAASAALVAAGLAAGRVPAPDPLVAHVAENYLSALLAGGGALRGSSDAPLAALLDTEPLPPQAPLRAPAWHHFDPQRPLVRATDHQLCRLGEWEDEACARDGDGDGHPLARDCNDLEPDVHPGAIDLPRNGLDEDCSGLDADPPNVIFVHWEGVRAVNVGSIGYAESSTPRFDALARDGLLFADAYANGMQTRWSLISVYCSILPRLSNRWIFKHDRDLELLCVPDILRRRGYETIYVHGGTIGFAGKLHRLGPWFERRYDRTNEPIRSMPRLNWGAKDRDVLAFTWELLTERQSRRPERPFFLTIATLAVHHPFAVPEPRFRVLEHTDPRNQLSNVIRYTDDALGEFLERLLADPRFENTVVLVASDHGINWFAPHPQREQNVLWEDLVWVPMALLGRAWNVEPGVVREVRQLADVGPTILDRLGIVLPNPFVGHSLLRRYPEGAERESRAFFATANGGRSAGVRVGRYKYFEHFDTGMRRLYDLEEDRRETRDLSREPSQAERVALLSAWLRSVYRTNERLIDENRIWSERYRLEPDAGAAARGARP